MKIVSNLVVRKGDEVEVDLGGKTVIGVIVKYPSNAQITIWDIDSAKKYIISKEDIVEVTNFFVPPVPKPKVRTEKEQKRIDEITTKVLLYLELLDKQITVFSKRHEEMVRSSSLRLSPRAICETNDEKIRLERLSSKISRHIDPLTGKFDSDLIRIICDMVDRNKIDFEIENK